VRKTLSLLVALVATLALASTALGAITFHSGPTVTWNNDGSATATGDLSGLGNTPATASLSITTQYTYTCQNPGGNVAPGQKSVGVVGATSTQTLSTDKNGRATLNVTAFPGTPADTISGKQAGCPNGNWTGVNPTAGATTATLTITQGGKVIYTNTYTKP